MPEPATKDDIERLFVLMQDFKESLEREIKGLAIRFDTQAARMERHAGLLQTGSRWSARMNEWSEKVDSALEQKDRQIADLSERLRKLEEDAQSSQ